MQVQLLGTGSADGWPNPFCRCRSCALARTSGNRRSPTAALVDGELLLECGPSVLGADVTRARHILVTHAHPDHWHPQAWYWLDRAGADVEVVGPPAVVSIAAEHGLPHRAVRAGDSLDVGEHRVRVLAAAHGDGRVGPAVLYDITASDGQRLLWATDTGRLPESALSATAAAAYDVVCLDETFGDRPESADHLDLAGFAATVDALRSNGAITPATTVLAVHLGHGNPPDDELRARLAAVGALPAYDGQRISPGGVGGRVLVLGGARSGKSAWAEQRAAAAGGVTYVATAPDRPGDLEWAHRIARHRARRPSSWTTVESSDLAGVLSSGGGTLLIDDLGLWLTTAMNRADAWDGDSAALTAAVDALVGAWRETRADVLLVSPEVGLGVVPATVAGRRFRDELGALNARLAAAADEVWLVTAGIARRLA